MKKEELKKGMKVWCWWKSRNLYYTGKIINKAPSAFNDFKGETVYVFEDICGAVTHLNEKDLNGLERK